MSIQENGKQAKKHIIDQTAFDEAVKENVELLDMSPEEAIEEAQTQFKSQNVDLSNIITDAYLHGGIQEHPFVKNFNSCVKLSKEPVLNIGNILDSLKLVLKDIEKDVAKKLYAGNNGGYEMGIELLQIVTEQGTQNSSQVNTIPETIEKLQLTIIEFLIKIMTGYPDLLNSKDVPLLLNILKPSVSQNQKDPSHSRLTQYMLDLISATLVLHENNRELWSNSPLFDILLPLLDTKHFTTLLRMLSLFRAMTLDDDIRVEVPNTHERVRKLSDAYLARLTQMLGEIEDVVKENEEDNRPVSTQSCQLTTSLLRTISCLCVRNEHCATVADHSGLTSLHAVLRGSIARCLEASVCPQESELNVSRARNREGSIGQEMELCIAAMGLINTIAGNDDVKDALYETGLVEAVVHCFSVLDEHKSPLSPLPLYSAYLLLLARLSLRHTPIVTKLVELNVMEVIVSVMRQHIESLNIVKYGAWVLRNILSRHKPAVESVLQVGGAEVLEAGLKRHPSIGFDIKSALKEMGDVVDVKMEEQWTGKGGLNFKPEF